MPVTSLPAAAAPRARAATAAAPGAAGPRAPRVGATGVLLAISALLLGASAIPGLRMQVGGLLVHPVNFSIVALFLIAAPRRLALLPDRLLMALSSFSALFVLSALTEDRSTTTIVKFSASAFTLLAASIAVTGERAMRMSALALAASVGFLSIRAIGGIDQEGLGGTNPMQGVANENAFSLYALPSLLLGSYYALHGGTPRLQRLFLGASAIVTVMALFSTANRSGWLGAILISVLLSVRAVRRMRTFLLLAALFGAAGYLIVAYGNLEAIALNIRITEEGYSSDRLRVSLIQAAWTIGLENPILGVSPQRLPFELARLVPAHGRAIDAHNIFGLILGGSGFLGLIAFVALGLVLWQKPRTELTPLGREAHFLLRCMIVVAVARGMFSGEILFSPSFALGLGMCVGYCVATGVYARPQRRAQPLRRGGAPSRA